MAGELQVDYVTAKTVYFLLRNAVGQVWNGTTFESYLTANYATYPIGATEQGTASFYYAGNFPSVAAGTYYAVAKERIGGSPAESDPSIGHGTVNWAGSVVTVPLTSGQSVGILSGQLVNVFSGQLSGFSVTPLSGQFWQASGINAVVPAASISGVVANSGLFVTVLPANLSGVVANSGLFTSVPISSISGVVANSGLFVSVPIATISGNVASVLSGTVHLVDGAYSDLIPKGVLYWNFSGASNNSGIRNLLNAGRKLVGKVSLTAASGYLYVYKEDDATLALRQAVTTQSGAELITVMDTE